MQAGCMEAIEYVRGNAWKAFYIVSAGLLGALAIFLFLQGQQVLARIEALLFAAGSIYLLITVFRLRIILGKDFIEKRDIRTRRIDFKDIVETTVSDAGANIKSTHQTIHIFRDINAYRELIGRILRLSNKYHFDVCGDYLSARVDKYHANLRTTSANPKGGKNRTTRYSGTMQARLLSKGRVSRAFKVDIGRREYLVEYAGMGDGYECVLVEDAVVDFKRHIFWYAPEFRFPIGQMNGAIKVRFWPWLCIRSFILEIDGRTVYSETWRKRLDNNSCINT